MHTSLLPEATQHASGQQPLLLMLPGMVCSAASWQPQRLVLEAYVDIAIADYPREDHVTVMARRLLGEHSGPLLLAGHSMGGRVALEMVRLAPERVVGLCLIATESRARPSGDRGIAEDLARQRLHTMAVEKGMSAMAEAWIPSLLGPLALRDASLQTILKKMIIEHSPESLAMHINAGKTRPDSYNFLSRITCPTLLIAGELDSIRPPAVLEEMHLAITNSDFLVIKGCGHMPMIEAAEIVNQAMLTWLHRSLSC